MVLLVYLIHEVNESMHIQTGSIISLRISFSKSPESFIINYFEKSSANAISSQYDVQYMKIVASETTMQNILESLKQKGMLVHDKLSRKEKRQNLSKSNSDEAVLSL